MNVVAIWLSGLVLLALGVLTIVHLVRSRMQLTDETRDLWAALDRSVREQHQQKQHGRADPPAEGGARSEGDELTPPG